MADKQPDDEGSDGPGSATDQVTVGSFVLEVGAPAGTLISLAPSKPAKVPKPLAEAIDADVDVDAGTRTHASAMAADAEEAVGDASEVTDKVERALELFKTFTEGKILDRKSLSGEVDDLLALLGRLDRKERWKDELRLARALSGLLALLMRWSDLIQSLRTVLRVAHDGDSDSAWALHELGTLHLAGRDTRGADQLLDKARRAREKLGDRRGLAATERSMQVLCHVLREDLRAEHGQEQDKTLLQFLQTPIGALVAALVLFGAGGVAGAMIGDSSAPGSPATGTSAAHGPPSTGSHDRDAPVVTIDPPSQDSALATKMSFAGTGGRASGDLPHIVLRIFETATASRLPAVIARIEPDGSWRVPSAGSPILKPATTYTAFATQQDRAGNIGTSRFVTFTTGRSERETGPGSETTETETESTGDTSSPEETSSSEEVSSSKEASLSTEIDSNTETSSTAREGR